MPGVVGNTAGGNDRISSSTFARRIFLNQATIGGVTLSTSRFSVLGLGRLLVTITQTAGAPGAVGNLLVSIQSTQVQDVVDQVTIAAVNTPYNIETPSGANQIEIQLASVPAGAEYVVLIQGMGTT